MQKVYFVQCNKIIKYNVYKSTNYVMCIPKAVFSDYFWYDLLRKWIGNKLTSSKILQLKTFPNERKCNFYVQGDV